MRPDIGHEPCYPLAVADTALEGFLLQVHGVHVLLQLVFAPEAANTLVTHVLFANVIGLVDSLVLVHIIARSTRVIAMIALVELHVEVNDVHVLPEQKFTLGPPAALVTHVRLLVLRVVRALVLPHLVASICLVGTFVALFHFDWPWFHHGAAEELEGVVEGPLPAT